jgi:hypothetical protein
MRLYKLSALLILPVLLTGAYFPVPVPLDVALQDQTTPSVGLYLHQDTGSITLASSGSIGDTIITLVAGHGVVAGDIICLIEGDRWYQGIATNVATNVISLTSPLDYAYTAGATCHKGNVNANVNGAVTPVVFHIAPPSGVQWDITLLTFTIIDNAVMASNTFGGLSSLTNGIQMRIKNGIYHNIFNARNNGELWARCAMPADPYDPKPPAGAYGFRCLRKFGGQGNTGVVFRLDGDDNDEMQLIIQDDLTGLINFFVLAQGHKVDL